ncbi:MAG: hypothetical protein WBM44_19055 [Waterburya sp.]
MNEINFSTSACRYCRFYEPQGRRGGSCQMLGVPVQSSWKACNLASPPFETTVKKLEDIFQLETSIPLDSPTKLFSNTSGIPISENSLQMASPQSE